MRIRGLELSEEDRGELARIVKKGHDWRILERAQSTHLVIVRPAQQLSQSLHPSSQ